MQAYDGEKRLAVVAKMNCLQKMLTYFFGVGVS